MSKTQSPMIEHSIINKLREYNVAYIDKNGRICTFNKTSPYIDELSNLLRSSFDSFDGKYFGITPEIILEDEDTVRTEIANIVSNSKKTVTRNSEGGTNEASANLTNLLTKALEMGVSDIHLINDVKMDTSFINFRVDGELLPIMEQSFDWSKQILTYATMKLAGRQVYKDDERDNFQFQINITQTVVVEGKPEQTVRSTNWRYSQVPASRGSKVTIRAIDAAGGKVPNLETELGLGRGHSQLLLDIAYSGQGALIVSGPTGSGKTTTINSLLTYVPETKMIHTIEDPPEWSLTRRNEVQTKVDEDFINSKTNERTKTFFVYGKDMLRNDTDVVYSGEVRDKESAKVFFRMSETGQLAITTLHSNNSISIVSALVQQMGIDPSQLSAPGTLKALSHQRLVRKVCPSCSFTLEKAKELNDPQLNKRIKILEKLSTKDGTYENARFKNDLKSNTCNACKQTGEKGRTSVFEIIMIDAKSREFIQTMNLNGWAEYLKDIGWKSFQDHALHKIRVGDCDVDSVMKQVDGLIQIKTEDLYKDLF